MIHASLLDSNLSLMEQFVVSHLLLLVDLEMHLNCSIGLLKLDKMLTKVLHTIVDRHYSNNQQLASMDLLLVYRNYIQIDRYMQLYRDVVEVRLMSHEVCFLWDLKM